MDAAHQGHQQAATHNPAAPQGPPVEFRFTPDQISAELAQAGFALQAHHDFLPQQLFLIYGVK